MKKTNKGFSLVELIIVIAIMAILAAAIAPALIRYIDKSRRADDVTAAGTLLTAVQTALADEDCYSEIAAVKPAGSASVVIVTVTNKKTVSAVGTYLKSEIESSIGSGLPIKYTKDKANSYSVAVDGNDLLSVYIGKSGGRVTEWQIQPSTDKKYK